MSGAKELFQRALDAPTSPLRPGSPALSSSTSDQRRWEETVSILKQDWPLLVGTSIGNGNECAYLIDPSTLENERQVQLLVDLGTFGQTKAEVRRWIDSPANLFLLSPTFRIEFEELHAWTVLPSLQSCRLLLRAIRETNEDCTGARQNGSSTATSPCFLPRLALALKAEGWSAGLQYDLIVLRPLSIGFRYGSAKSKQAWLLHPQGQDTDDKFCPQENGEVVDAQNQPFPPFFHHSSRKWEDQLHPAAVVLSALNKLLHWRKTEGEEALKRFSPRMQELVDALMRVAEALFSRPFGSGEGPAERGLSSLFLSNACPSPSSSSSADTFTALPSPNESSNARITLDEMLERQRLLERSNLQDLTEDKFQSKAFLPERHELLAPDTPWEAKCGILLETLFAGMGRIRM